MYRYGMKKKCVFCGELFELSKPLPRNVDGVCKKCEKALENSDR